MAWLVGWLVAYRPADMANLRHEGRDEQNFVDLGPAMAMSTDSSGSVKLYSRRRKCKKSIKKVLMGRRVGPPRLVPTLMGTVHPKMLSDCRGPSRTSGVGWWCGMHRPGISCILPLRS